MLNYMKSECYRILHEKEVYLIAGILALLTVVMNVALFIFQRTLPDFAYSNVRYSLNILTDTLTITFTAGLLITGLLSAERKKNHVIKNEVAFGISRTSLFWGNCFVNILFSIICMVITILFYVGSAYLLLEGEGTLPLTKLLEGIGAALPSALASVILAVALYALCNTEVLAMMWWVVIMYVIPYVLYLIGLKVAPVAKIASWLPWNVFKYEVYVTRSIYQCVWDTPVGLMKCIIIGVVGIVVFGVLGTMAFRKKDF